MTSLDDFRELVDGVNHPEGVAWDPAAGCLYAGGETGELYRIDPAGKAELLGSTGGWMLGLAVDGDGRVYACDHGRGRIARYDPDAGTFEDYGHGRTEPFDTPNVAVFDPTGNLYLTCSGEEGRPEIARVDAEGAITTWTTDVPGYPNGAVVTPDADGLALDAEGYLWVTLYRPDGLVRVAPDGTIVERIDDLLAGTLNAPTNIAFYGDRLERAAVATVGSRYVLDVDLGVAGQPLFYPKGLA